MAKRKSAAQAAPAAQLAGKTPRRLKQIEAKRSAILDAALHLFSRYGLHGTAVDQIAEMADVSKTNLFYYFASKEELYVEALKRLLDVWLAPLRSIELDQDPFEAIGTYIRRKVEFSRVKPEASRLFCLEIVAGAPLLGNVLRSSLKSLVDAKAVVIKGWIASGKLAPINPYHLIFSIWAVTQHYADFSAQVEAVVGGNLDDKDFREEVITNIQQLILDGIRARISRPENPELPR